MARPRVNPDATGWQCPGGAGGTTAAAADGAADEAAADAASSDAPADPPANRQSLAPPEIEGVDMYITRFKGDGPTLESELPDLAAVFAPLLEALGADMEALTYYQVDSGGSSAEPGYQTYIALRIEGAGDGELSPAFLEAFGLASVPGIEPVQDEVAGKAVTELTGHGLPDTAVYLYDAGDTAYLIQMTPELAASLLEALP